MATLRENNVSAPIFIAVATKCGKVFFEDNPVAIAQRELIDNENVFLGANTDTLLKKSDRMVDECHFSKNGQLKTSKAFANAIYENR